MMKLRSGNLIYLSSFRSKVSSRGISLYAASKAFGEMFFETIERSTVPSEYTLAQLGWVILMEE